MSPGTEFARDFCAGIGPLQLGVVLVHYIYYSNDKKAQRLVAMEITTFI